LLYGEQFRFPSSSEWRLRILSGKAWISFEGQDFILGSGESLAVPKVKNGGIISAMGKEALFYEIT
jgi:mannose-6-phosphate isomerase-like protein (cupin superfamily)